MRAFHPSWLHTTGYAQDEDGEWYAECQLAKWAIPLAAWCAAVELHREERSRLLAFPALFLGCLRTAIGLYW